MRKRGNIPTALNARVESVFQDSMGRYYQFSVIHAWSSLAAFLEDPIELIFDGKIVFVGKPNENGPTAPLFLKRFFTSPILAAPIDQVWVRIDSGQIVVGFERAPDVSVLAPEVVRILTEYYEEMKRESRVVVISADEVHGKSRMPYQGGIWRT